MIPKQVRAYIPEWPRAPEPANMGFGWPWPKRARTLVAALVVLSVLASAAMPAWAQAEGAIHDEAEKSAAGQGELGPAGEPDADASDMMTGAGAAPETDEPWRAEAVCPRDQVAPRDYNRCLFDATRASEQALEAALGRALVMISGRVDLAPVQRTAWRNLLEDAQARFRLFRNFDCQSVAPFEGPRGIGNFEQRSLCLINANRMRAQALERRYLSPAPAPPASIKKPPVRPVARATPATLGADTPPAATPPAPVAPDGPQPRLGVWIYPTAPVVY